MPGGRRIAGWKRHRCRSERQSGWQMRTVREMDRNSSFMHRPGPGTAISIGIGSVLGVENLIGIVARNVGDYRPGGPLTSSGQRYSG